MRQIAAIVFIGIALAASAEDSPILRLGMLSLSFPPSWQFEGSNFRAEGRGPDGEGVIVSYRTMKTGAPTEVIENHWKVFRGFAAEKMPELAAKNGEVLKPLTETKLPEGRVEFSTVTQGTKSLRDYYFLQYLFISSRMMAYFTVEGFGSATEAADRFERILSTRVWNE